jgi:hypothetical protein
MREWERRQADRLALREQYQKEWAAYLGMVVKNPAGQKFSLERIGGDGHLHWRRRGNRGKGARSLYGGVWLDVGEGWISLDYVDNLMEIG